jgi:hypothetical protein
VQAEGTVGPEAISGYRLREKEREGERNELKMSDAAIKGRELQSQSASS